MLQKIKKVFWNKLNNEKDPWGSDKDPWGRNKKQNPPDIDELINKFLSSFGGIFGYKKQQKGNNGGNNSFFSLKKVLIAIIVIWFGSGFYIVSENERAVIKRFGSYERTSTPGPGWHMPFPIESREIVNFTGIRSVEKRTTMLTKDENIVELAFSVQYKVQSAEDFLFNVENPDIEGDKTCGFGALSTICGVLDSAIREVVGNNEMDFILREGRTEVSTKTQEIMQIVLDQYGSGIIVTTVNLQDSQPPAPVQESFQDATRAREDMERYKNEAEAYANEIIPQARGEAARMIQDSLAYKAKVVANAEGEANRFSNLLKEYKKNPEVTRKRLYLDALESVYSRSSKILVDVKKGNNLMLLPLEKILSSKEVQESIKNDESQEKFQEKKSKTQRNIR